MSQSRQELGHLWERTSLVGNRHDRRQGAVEVEEQRCALGPLEDRLEGRRHLHALGGFGRRGGARRLGPEVGPDEHHDGGPSGARHRHGRRERLHGRGGEGEA